LNFALLIDVRQGKITAPRLHASPVHCRTKYWFQVRRDQARVDSKAMMGTSRRLPIICIAAATGLLTMCFIGMAPSQNRRADTQNDGSYFPIAVGNWWLYKLGGDSRVAGKSKKWTVTDSAIENGVGCYTLSPIPPFGDDAPWELSPAKEGIQECDGRFILRYPVRIRDRWSYESQRCGATGKLNQFEVVSAGKPCSVGGHSFHDCATVREIDEPLKLFSLTTYSRGIGPVKFVYFKDLHFKQIDWTLTITSWDVQRGKRRSKPPTEPPGSYKVDQRFTE
jgi:hypothetical protein